MSVNLPSQPNQVQSYQGSKKVPGCQDQGGAFSDKKLWPIVAVMFIAAGILFRGLYFDAIGKCKLDSDVCRTQKDMEEKTIVMLFVSMLIMFAFGPQPRR